MRHLIIILLVFAAMTTFGQNKDSTDTTKIILISEPMPSYPGGHAEMNNFIKHNLLRPRGSRKIKGTVYIEFIVNLDGSLSSFKVVKGLMKTFDDSALRTVMMMPHWIPAEKDNKPVQTKVVIPIKFD